MAACESCYNPACTRSALNSVSNIPLNMYFKLSLFSIISVILELSLIQWGKCACAKASQNSNGIFTVPSQTPRIKSVLDYYVL